MKEKKNFSFFAAANGYGGFRSYFSEIFNPKDYSKIYILKGGPGTGKSTIMKSLYSHFKNNISHSEAIYCSSDPKSFDGVILESENKKIAVIDGTAPHERDALFPGAIDEIINLGDGWDKRWLEAKKDEIISLSDEKRNAYKTAYSYLSSAGLAHRAKNSLDRGAFDVKNAKDKIKSLAESIKFSETPKKNTRLISAFGKGGSVRIDTLRKISKHYIGVYGSERAVCEFLELFSKETESISDIIRIPSPLDDSVTEGLYYPDSELAVVSDDLGDSTVCADDFYKTEILDKERSRVFSDTELTSLKEAQRWFNIASDLHARLEEIYSEAMNFENNEKILLKLKDEISEKIRS